MKPYPLALLNHFTVPCKRSTFAPPARILSLPRTCLVICCNCASGEGACQGLPAEEGLSVRLERVSLMAQPEQAANRFSIADCPAHHPTNGVPQGNQALLDHLVSFGLRSSSTQPTRQINVHGLGHEAGTGIKLQNAFPARRGVTGFFQKFSFGGSERVFAFINAAGR